LRLDTIRLRYAAGLPNIRKNSLNIYDSVVSAYRC